LTDKFNDIKFNLSRLLTIAQCVHFYLDIVLLGS